MARKRLKLMIPGPVTVDPLVMEAMGEPVQPHYGVDFANFYYETTGLLQKVFDTSGDVFIMNGSGSVGTDACIGSALSTGEKIIVAANGFFGDRLKWIGENYGLQVVAVDAPWGKPIAARDVARAFRKHPDAKAIVMVHLETSTTVANPVAEVGQIAREHGACYIVDAISSLGGLPFHMDEWGVDLCASASQKCLGAPPGLCPVAVSAHGWQMIDRDPKKDHGWYGDLRVWRHYTREWAGWHPFPVTMAVNNIAALRVGLEQLLAEGIETRLARYTQLALRLRAGLRAIGMQPFTSDEMMVPVLTAAYGPPGVPTTRIVDYLAEEHGIKISSGLGSLHDKIIRIGHMSPLVTEADIDQVLDALKSFKA